MATHDAMLVPASATPAELREAKKLVRVGTAGDKSMAHVKGGLVQQADTEYMGGSYRLLTPVHPGPFAPQYVPDMFKFVPVPQGMLAGTLLTGKELEALEGEETRIERVRAAVAYYREHIG